MNKPITKFCWLLAIAVAVAGCQNRGKVVSQPEASVPPATKAIKRTAKDGAPWWDKDVSNIPDAVPTPHYGPYKAAPYAVLGKKYYPIQDASKYKETGMASWYGTKFHGQDTANGEKYDLYGMTAAHKTLPLPSYVQVTNLDNGEKVVLRVNDRGPFYADRIIDLSFAAAKKLGFAEKGVARVKVEGINPEQWWAQQGKQAPVMGTYQASNRFKQEAVEQYEPPLTQHAGAVLPLQVQQQATQNITTGLYLQAGAFANPDAAQLLRDKLTDMTQSSVFVSSVVVEEQVLHRVRIGPIASRNDAELLQQRIREANLATPSLVFNN